MMPLTEMKCSEISVLRLRDLMNLEFKGQVKKRVSLIELNNVLEEVAVNSRKATVSIFLECGSNELCFRRDEKPSVVEELVNDEEVKAVEEATPEQVEQAREVPNKLKLHQVAKQLAEEQAFMLKQWPMTMLVELLPRTDLPKAVEIQREQAEAGLNGAYESLTKTKEFKDFKNAMKCGLKVNKSISDDREIEAKQLMRKCRLCLIKEMQDLQLVETNGMECTLVIGSNLGEVAETAKRKGIKYLVHHDKAGNPIGNGESKVMKVAVLDVVKKSTSKSRRRDDGHTKRRKMG